METQTRGSTCPRGKFQNIDFKICFRIFLFSISYHTSHSTTGTNHFITSTVQHCYLKNLKSQCLMNLYEVSSLGIAGRAFAHISRKGVWVETYPAT
jgi:hypothetical protein